MRSRNCLGVQSHRRIWRDELVRLQFFSWSAIADRGGVTARRLQGRVKRSQIGIPLRKIAKR